MKRHSFLSLCMMASLCVLPACDFAKNQLAADREGSLEIQDYKDALAPRDPEIDTNKKANDYAAIPALQPYVADASSAISAMPLVSISINQTIPLRDALFELVQQADYDIELDPRIRGAIIFSAREKPLDEVIERISDMAGLRYKFMGETLRVELDTPYNQTFKVDYLNFVRSNSSNISNDISVVSGDGTDTGSGFESSFESESDFWKELEASIQQILASVDTNILLTANNPQIEAQAQNPNAPAVVTTAPDGSQVVAPPNVQLNVGQLGGDEEAYESPDLSYAINKQAGIIQIFAPHKVQKKVSQYLKLLKKSMTAQVLIEAKILEVSLTDQYATGIDWRLLNMSGEGLLGYATGTGTALFSAINGVNEISNPVNIGGPAGVDGAIGSSGFTVGYAGNDIQALVQAVSGFGAVKALASPRLTVLNNQAAILNVATNHIFFEINIDSNTTDGGGVTTALNSEIRNVPVGVLINVLPSIDLDGNTVSLALRPTVTNILRTKNDPSVAFAVAQAEAADPTFDGSSVTSAVPELDVQEIDSVIKLKSGQTAVMGGLLKDRVDVSEDGIPGLSEVPLLGNLFKQKADRVQKSEIVVFLKATIINDPSDTIHNTDRDLYRKFGSDRRPFKL